MSTALRYPASVTAVIPDPRSTFLYGRCWYLSWHLHRLSGAPLLALADEGEWCHGLVELPGDAVLDVEGRRPRTALLAEWGDPAPELHPVPPPGSWPGYRHRLGLSARSDPPGPDFAAATAALAAHLLEAG